MTPAVPTVCRRCAKARSRGFPLPVLDDDTEPEPEPVNAQLGPMSGPPGWRAGRMIRLLGQRPGRARDLLIRHLHDDDHIHPYAAGWPTSDSNGQRLSVRCDLVKAQASGPPPAGGDLRLTSSSRRVGSASALALFGTVPARCRRRNTRNAIAGPRLVSRPCDRT